MGESGDARTAAFKAFEWGHMKYRVVLLGGILTYATVTSWGAPQATERPPSPPLSPAKAVSDFRPVIDRYCVTCHNQRLKLGGLALDKLDMANIEADGAIWEKVIRKLRTGVMPPQGLPKPSDADRQALASALETTLDRAAALHPFPGSPSVHRLNRAEYANAIRDLIALDIDPEKLLPPDDPAYGFDNIGEVLALSPALLDRYTSVAEQITTLAIGNKDDVVQGSQVFRAPTDLSQDKHNDGLPLGTTGGFVVKTTVPLDGEYILKSSLFSTNLGLIRGLEFPRQFEFLVDGQVVFSRTVGGEAEFVALLKNLAVVADDLEARLQARVPIKAGPHEIGATFAGRPEVMNSKRLQAMLRTTSDTAESMLGPPHIETLTIVGPFNPTGPGDTPSRRRIFTCHPARVADENACAKSIISTLAHRAYRGTETAANIQDLLGIYRAGRADGNFETAIGLALQRILTGPKFLVRIEHDQNVRPGIPYSLSDIELASRLSFFLWSSIPDDELLQLAIAGKLKDPVEFERQGRRMLADSKSRALVDNFAGQWLQLRNLKSSIPDSREFPNFDDQLRQAFRRETELFFGSILQEDRSVVDLLTANYTFVNERLAKHYGIPHVYGDQFRRVEVSDEARKGLLGQGSILTVTSHADRTSPVVRGKWVLDNLMGAPPPPPPPNVPPLKENGDFSKPMTMRERMELHRANPACASCHKAMDPLGFALENYDAVGAWRDRESRVPIETTGVFIDGSTIDGVVSLRQAVLRRPDNFVTAFTEKLLIYALGRGLDYRDMPTLRSIVQDSARSNYRFSTILLDIVRSVPFQKRLRAVNESQVARVEPR
jgi:mono/diheme cytochrome c family protein